MAEGEEFIGTMAKVRCIKGSFGFIQQDEGDIEMFVLPQCCPAFGNVLPAVGTRVVYTVVDDAKTGKPRAEDVRPAPEHDQLGGAIVTDPDDDTRRAGTMNRGQGKFGFIKQDHFPDKEDDMFVMPASCQSFGGMLPPIGTRLTYEVVTDEKTGKPRAEAVEPEQKSMASSKRPASQIGDSADSAGFGDLSFSQRKRPNLGKGSGQEFARQTPHRAGKRSSGTMARKQGSFGFIQQDNGDEDMFVMPVSCDDIGGLPPIGTRLSYDIVNDSKTGRPRAENVGLEVAVLLDSGEVTEWPSGTMARSSGTFGFIKQDSGEDDMFLLPQMCEALGNALPEIGTRLVYSIGTDPKTGRPRAENVALEEGDQGAVNLFPQWGAANQFPQWGFEENLSMQAHWPDKKR